MPSCMPATSGQETVGLVGEVAIVTKDEAFRRDEERKNCRRGWYIYRMKETLY